MRFGFFLVIVPLAIVVTAAYFAITYARRRSQLARLRAMAPGTYVFTFN